MSAAEASILEARARLAAGDRTGAAARLAQVPPDAPERLEALLALGRLHLNAGEPQLAAPWLQEAARIDVAGWLPWGACLLALGRAVEAEATFDQVLAGASTDVQALVLRAQAQSARGVPGEAVKSLDQALRTNPRHEGARFYLAEALVRLGDLKRADLQLHWVLQRHPSYGPARALRGECFRRLGNHVQAAAELALAHKLMPEDAVVLEKLGLAFAAIGDVSQALLAFDGALARNPGRLPAMLGLARTLETPAGAYEARRAYLRAQGLPGGADEAAAGLARVAALLAGAGLPAAAPPDWAALPRAAAFEPPAPVAGGSSGSLSGGLRPGATSRTRPLGTGGFGTRGGTGQLSSGTGPLGGHPPTDVTPLPGALPAGATPIPGPSTMSAAAMPGPGPGPVPVQPGGSGPLQSPVPARPLGTAPLVEPPPTRLTEPAAPGLAGSAPPVERGPSGPLAAPRQLPGTGPLQLPRAPAGPADADGLPPPPSGPLRRGGTGPLNDTKRSGLSLEPRDPE